MTPAPIVIDVDRLTRRYGAKIVVDQLTLQVPQSAVFGFLGPNGSGKTTLIRMMCGVLRPSSGRARVLDCDVVADPERVKRSIGYMSQKFSLYADLSVEENMDFYGRIYDVPRARLRQRKRELLDLVGMHEFQRQLAGTLSGGWKQRLALACALIHEPRMLFLDEPTAGIDPVARRDLWDLLFELSGRGVTLFVTTHYMDEAERCTHVGYIYLGRLIVCGRPEELKQMPEITPAGTRREELRCTQPSAALPKLRGLPGVRDVTLFGDALHLLIDDSLTEKALLEHLHGVCAHASVQPMDPSLEDVFVTLSRREAARDHAA
ncbi:MAG: ABC transporter ATP-binding protein [Phycisphaerales bacterium]|nr:ABC transporter ATP-binding protein [Phycisphaerales bacterium]